MGVLTDDTARACLEDCLCACTHLGEANVQRFEERDAKVYASHLFTVRISSAERAILRAKESRAQLTAAAHSRAVRVCQKAYEGCTELMMMIEDRHSKKKVQAFATKLLRHCNRALE